STCPITPPSSSATSESVIAPAARSASTMSASAARPNARSWMSRTAGASGGSSGRTIIVRRASAARPLAGRPIGLAVLRQRALGADRVRALEDPVLPGAQAGEDLRVGVLGAGEAEGGLHAGQRVRREAHALLNRDADVVVPVDLVGCDGDEAELVRLLRRDGAALAREHALDVLRVAEEAGLEPARAVGHRVAPRVERRERDAHLLVVVGQHVDAVGRERELEEAAGEAAVLL